MLPSLLKSILRARSSIALLSILTPRWALKRCHVWRNSSMEIRPEHSRHFNHSQGKHFNQQKEYFTGFTRMVLVYDIKDDFNVLPVSKQSFSQVWGDLNRNKQLLLNGHSPIGSLKTETASSTPSVSGERTIHSITKYSIGDNLGLKVMLKDTYQGNCRGPRSKQYPQYSREVFVNCYTTKWLKGN